MLVILIYSARFWTLKEKKAAHLAKILFSARRKAPVSNIELWSLAAWWLSSVL